MKCEVISATKLHAESLAPKLRKQDRDEVWASSGNTPRDALLESLAHSYYAWTALFDGEPVAMFGASDMGASVGGAWLLGSDRMLEHPLVVWRVSMRLLHTLHERFEILTNYVDARNSASIHWLTRLGFEPVDAELEYGVGKSLFIRYESFRREHGTFPQREPR